MATFGQGLFEGLNQSLLPFLQKRLEEKHRQQEWTNLLQSSMRPTATTDYISPEDKAKGYLPTVSMGTAPVGMDDPNFMQAIGHAAVSNPDLLNTFLAIRKMNEPQFKEIPAGMTYGIMQGARFTPQGTTDFRPPTSGMYGSAGNVNILDEQGNPIVANVGINKQSGKRTLVPLGRGQSKQTGEGAGNWVQTKDAMGMPTGFVNKITGEAKPLSASAKELVGAPLSSTTKTMIETAPKVKELVGRLASQIDAASNDKGSDQLGALAGRWNQFMTGKIGAANPEFNKIRVNAGLLATLLMRMHVGARGSEKIMEKFDNLLGIGYQSPENLKAALQEISDYANSVEAEKAGIDSSTSTQKKVVRTGTNKLTGKKVIQYDDGTVEEK